MAFHLGFCLAFPNLFRRREIRCPDTSGHHTCGERSCRGGSAAAWRRRRLRWYRSTALWKARQAIIGVKPRHARTRPDVVLDLRAARFIEAPDAHLHPVCENLLPHAECAAAG